LTFRLSCEWSGPTHETCKENKNVKMVTINKNGKK
jgi:hypothetical protein